MVIGFLSIINYGCNKEKETSLLDSELTVCTNKSHDIDIKAIDGTLVFSDWKELDHAILKLSSLSNEDRVKLENKIGFKSLKTIFFEIHQAENVNVELNYGDLDEDLSVDDLKRLGIEYKPSNLYLEYLQKGVIEEIIEDDGSLSFKLKLNNWPLSHVANSNGLIIIKDEKIDLCKVEFNVEVGEDFISNVSKTYENDFEIYDGGSRSRWSSTSPRYDDPHDNYRRVQVFFTGASYQSSTQTLSSNYTIEVIAERRVLGFWKIRNTYKPLRRVTGWWSYEYYYRNSSGGSVLTGSNDLPLPSSPPIPMISPVDYDIYAIHGTGSNHIVWTLHPTGIFSRQSPSQWDSPILMGPREFSLRFRSSSNWRINYSSHSSQKWTRLSY
jgi:hypothetical protein